MYMLYTYKPGIAGVTRTTNVNALGKFNMSITTCYCLIYKIFLHLSDGVSWQVFRTFSILCSSIYLMYNENLHASHKYIHNEFIKFPM